MSKTEESQPTVLIVDDERGPRESLRMILAPSHSVHRASGGSDALEILRRTPVDVVTLDLDMPGICGSELMRALRTEFPHVEVIAITGCGSLESATEAIRFGICDYLQRPFDVVQVTAAVSRAVERRRARTPAAVPLAVRRHHEWWDGTGYPDGLAGDEIPLPARLIAVADAFDAMSCDRPYRPALPRDVVIAELRRLRGVQFDPAIAEELLAILETRAEELDVTLLADGVTEAPPAGAA
jgi:response regulator RpfG family c-di-GMP phosphodiesterase